MDEVKYPALLRASVILVFLAMVAVNALANLLPLNGITTAAVSDSYPNLFVPAGFTFLVWSLIYILLAGYCVYQAFFAGRQGGGNRVLYKKIAGLFSISSLANTAWIFTWHYGLPFMSLVMIVVLLACLVEVSRRLRETELSHTDAWLMSFPFHVYYGWITVATIANIVAVCVSFGWHGTGPGAVTGTIIFLMAGMIAGSLILLGTQQIAYGAVLIWAYTGILVKHLSPTGFNRQYPLVIVAVIASLLVFIFLEWRLVVIKKGSRAKSADA